MRSMFQTACSDRKVQRKSLKIREEFIPLKSLGGNTVPVQVRSPAPNQKNPNPFPTWKIWFGFLFILIFLNNNVLS